MVKTKYVLRESQGRYYSKYDYKQNREPIERAKTWVSIENLEAFLQTDNYRRRAKYSKGDLVIEEVNWDGVFPHLSKPIKTIRTIPAAEVRSAAALASTRAQRRARGLIN